MTGGIRTHTFSALDVDNDGGGIKKKRGHGMRYIRLGKEVMVIGSQQALEVFVVSPARWQAY